MGFPPALHSPRQMRTTRSEESRRETEQLARDIVNYDPGLTATLIRAGRRELPPNLRLELDRAMDHLNRTQWQRMERRMG